MRLYTKRAASILLILSILVTGLVLGACEDRRPSSDKGTGASGYGEGTGTPKLVKTTDGGVVLTAGDTPAGTPVQTPAAEAETAAPEPEKETMAPVKDTPAEKPSDAKTTEGVSYGSLSNDRQRQLYKEIIKASDKITDKTNEGQYEIGPFELNYAIEKKNSVDVSAALAAVCADCPQLFWLANRWNGMTTTSQNSASTEITLYSDFSASKKTEMAGKLDAAVQKFKSTVPKDVSDYELEKHIHDYVCDACEYNKAVAAASGEEESERLMKKNPTVSNAYGVLVDGDAVCAGYAHAFDLLCDAVGLESAFITGRGEGERHAWNAFKLEGDWYMLDTTWDDKEDHLLRYQYFNLTSKEMYKDHEAITFSKDPDNEKCTPNVFLPDCNSTRYYYYEYDPNSLKVTKLSSEELGKAFVKAYQSGSDEATVYFKGLKFSDVLGKVESSDGYMPAFMKEAMDYLHDHTDASYDRYAYFTLDKRNVVAFRLIKGGADGKVAELPEEANHTM